mmetsp:Transcript_41491/g.132553  ORF Transcript_41491/g.132553 Transcript_41491/m.132553 type:complete len:246 (+) Transcript_41491:1169-1906(+)
MAALPWGNPSALEESGGGSAKRAREYALAEEGEPKAPRPNEESEGEGDGEGDAPCPLPLSSVGLEEGSRIEVCWDLVDEESGENRALWWAAKVRKPGGGEGAGERVEWELFYDIKEDEGYDEHESRNVQFLGEHELLDVAEGTAMRWRAEGDAWEDTVTLGDMMNELQEDEEAAQEGGTSMEELERQAMGNLTPFQQQQVAARMRGMFDKMREGLQKVAESRPGGVVTKEDIEAIMSSSKGKPKP